MRLCDLDDDPETFCSRSSKYDVSLKENLSNVIVEDEEQDEEAVWSEVKAALPQRRIKKKKTAMLGEMAQDETTNDATLLQQQVHSVQTSAVVETDS